MLHLISWANTISQNKDQRTDKKETVFLDRIIRLGVFLILESSKLYRLTHSPNC